MSVPAAKNSYPGVTCEFAPTGATAQERTHPQWQGGDVAKASPLAEQGCGVTRSPCSLWLEMLQLPSGAKLKGYHIAWPGLSYCFKLFSQFLAQAQSQSVTRIITGTEKPGIGTS